MSGNAKHAVMWAGVGALGATAAGLMFALAPIPGGLTPPAGPVRDTTPSLAELATSLSRLEVALTDNSDWKTLIVLTLTTSNQLNATLVIPGRVEVRRTVAVQAGFTLFDAPGGVVGGDGKPLNPVIAVHHNYNFVRGTSFSASPSQVDLGTVFPNGVYLGYVGLDSQGIIELQYRELD